MKLKNVKTILLFTVLSLSACGGSGDSTKKNNGGGTTTPTNTAPTITLSSSNINLNERSSITIDVSSSDAENDTVTVTASSNNNVLTTSYVDGVLTLTASEVVSDTAVTVTVKATDSKSALSSKTITINVLDKPNEAPILAWLEESPSRQVIERTTVVFPFSITDADTELSALTFSVEYELTGDGFIRDESLPTFEVDIENQQLIITALTTRFSHADLIGTFTVIDGNNQVSLPFNLKVMHRPSFAWMSWYKNFTIRENESIDKPFDIMAEDLRYFGIDEIGYVDEGDKESNLLSWELDFENRNITFTAKDNSASGANTSISIFLRFYEGDKEEITNQVTQYFVIDILPKQSENERKLQAEIARAAKHHEMSAEYERLSDFLAESLFMSNMISEQEYKQMKLEISYYKSFGSLDYDTIMINRKLESSDYYALDENFNEAMSILAKHIEDFELYTYGRPATATELLDRTSLSHLITDFPDWGVHQSYTYSENGLVSRFIGNALYGEFVDGHWQFFEQYSFMRAATAIALDIDNL